MKKQLLLILFGCTLGLGTMAQNITRVEYFFDTDPGFGNATAVTFTAAADVTTSFTPSITSLSLGTHRLFVRSRDANNKWSITNDWLFYKVVNPNLTNITRIEYFFDTDPGFGLATSVPFTSGTDVSNLSFTPSITALTAGTHRLFLRSRDTYGNWSVTNDWLFYKVANTALTNIARIEYFFDTDPGFGLATSVPFTAGNDVSNVSFTPSITALTAGTHRLFVRSRDTYGNWSVTNDWLFYKVANAALSNIARIEYFFDTDPGFGLATSVPFTAGTDVSNISFTPSITALSTGTHRLFVRSRDTYGNWSVSNDWLFYKVANTALTNITKVEYFFDTDPGFGNGTALSITPATNISDAVFNINTSALSNADHKLFIRSLDANGSWCITNVYAFTKTAALPVTLVNFAAGYVNNGVINTWQTSTEVNADYFAIERSTDGSNFTTIGKVAAKGGGDYSYTDNQLPVTPTIYYRLQMVDRDGSFTYSKVIAVTLNEKGKTLHIFPNPVKETLFVQLSASKAETVTLQITDMQGRVLQQQVQLLAIGSNNLSIKTSNLAKGSYVLVIKGQVVQQKQFVKE